MLKFLLISAGGGIGALLRYLVSGAAYTVAGGGFPWGTLVVNLGGSLMIGFLWELSQRLVFSPNLKTFVFIGLIGGFTTYSTYCLESSHLIRDGEIGLALWNVLGSTVAGVVLVFLGFAASRYFIQLLR